MVFPHNSQTKPNIFGADRGNPKYQTSFPFMQQLKRHVIAGLLNVGVLIFPAILWWFTALTGKPRCGSGSVHFGVLDAHRVIKDLLSRGIGLKLCKNPGSDRFCFLLLWFMRQTTSRTFILRPSCQNNSSGFFGWFQCLRVWPCPCWAQDSCAVASPLQGCHVAGCSILQCLVEITMWHVDMFWGWIPQMDQSGLYIYITIPTKILVISALRQNPFSTLVPTPK